MTKTEVIADFLCNGLEDYSVDEAAEYLLEEIGVPKEPARRLVADYLARFSARPVVMNDELFLFIESHLRTNDRDSK